MKPLILQYTEKSSDAIFDFSKIEYSKKLNLSVDKMNGLPAIEYLNLSTQTHTRTYEETTDSDTENINLMMGTVTKTSYQIEGTDDDAGYYSIKSIIDTMTGTKQNIEISDSDI